MLLFHVPFILLVTLINKTKCSVEQQYLSKRLQADHISFRIRVAVISKMQENARLSLFYKGLHRLAAASCPR